MADVPTSKPFGPVAAVFVAAGIGAVVLGILTTAAEASESFAETLKLNAGVGPLSGKTVSATVVFLAAWLILHLVWRGKDPKPGRIFAWTWILLAIGVVLTFPVFFQMFTAE